MDEKQKQYQQALEKKRAAKKNEKLEEEAKKFTPNKFKYKLLWGITNDHRLRISKFASVASGPNIYDLPYFHYGCDSVDDTGWGRGYRVLQMMCQYMLIKFKRKDLPVPSIKDIQKILVRTGHKPKSFERSKEPIGAKEAMIVLDAIYSHKAKLLETTGSLMNSNSEYFETYCGFGMLSTNNDEDCRGIWRTFYHFRPTYCNLMLVDTSYIGVPMDIEELRQKGYVYYKTINEFGSYDKLSICIPNI